MSERVQIDETDRRILALLEEDARRTIADISTHVNLSPAPVKRRIDRLERQGVIAGYSVVLDHGKLGSEIEAFTEVRFDGQADADAFSAEIAQRPEVREVFTMAGDPDALVRIRVADVAHLKQAVNQLRRSRNVTGTKSLIVLDHRSRIARRRATADPSADREHL
ncbi:MAG: Lrp/AsnC family transcriptional regulator [Patulibacter sp.]|nr:Lrp/AsnC family transcriptional regulator [Patulibacter sp.]